MIKAILLSALILMQSSAPDFALPKFNGDVVQLSKLRGSVVLVDFWASWCAFCQLTLPKYAKLQMQYADKNFKVVAVNLDKEAADGLDLAKPLEAAGVTVVYDNEGITPYRYNVKVMPTGFLIDREGNITAIFEGSKNSNLEELIEKAL